MALFREIAIEPLTAWAGFIDQDEVRAFRLQATDEIINVTLSRPTSAEGDELGVVVLGHRGDRDRIFMDVQSDIEHARLWPGWPRGVVVQGST
jgi:hypothetical protein